MFGDAESFLSFKLVFMKMPVSVIRGYTDELRQFFDFGILKDGWRKLACRQIVVM